MKQRLVLLCSAIAATFLCAQWVADSPLAISGYSWSENFRQAWMVEHRVSDHYDYIRQPLYSWMMGRFTPANGSYVLTALWVSRICVVLTALACCRVVWLLSPPATAVWGASLSLVLAGVTLWDVTLWGNGYPVSMAALALMLCAAVGFASRPGRVSLLALLAAAAVMLLTDSRALADATVCDCSGRCRKVVVGDGACAAAPACLWSTWFAGVSGKRLLWAQADCSRALRTDG